MTGTAPPAAALNGLGDAYLDKGDAVSAADHYRQSAESYAREGMYDNAIACCKKIRRYAPDDEPTSLLLGRYYAAKGLRADAARELEGYADRMDRAGRKKEATGALAELVQLTPGRPVQREKLARLHAEQGQHDAALEEYREARTEYHQLGDEEGAARVAERIAEHERDRSRPASPGDEPVSLGRPSTGEGAGPATAPPRLLETASETPTERPAIPLELEIEPTSYAAESPGDVGQAPAPPPAAAPSPLADAAAPPESAAGASLAPDGLAERAARLHEARRWEEAVDAYRELAESGAAEDDHFAAWTEAARQAGMASLVLEALAFQARWHLDGGRRASARRAAEEMLLVDPRNVVATDILSEVGSSLPRD